MRDPDIELQQLEDEFPASLTALYARAPRQLFDRVIAAARSSALQLAAGRRVEERPYPRFIPPRMRGKGVRPRFSKFAASSKSAPRPRFPGKDAFRDQVRFPAESMSVDISESSGFYAMQPPSFDEATRLTGRDEQTWLQRIAELSLQGNLEEARGLMELFESEFG
jgi:hypothetical protein